MPHKWSPHPGKGRAGEWKCADCGAESIRKPDDNASVQKVAGTLIVAGPNSQFSQYDRNDPTKATPLKLLTCEEASKR